MGMKLAVVGTGYIGLVSGVCFAEHGNTVWCVDVDTEKLQQLQRGISTIYEPGLEQLLQRNLQAGRVVFTSDLAEAVAAAQIIFLCLPTPPEEDGSADVRYVLQAARSVAQIISERGITDTRVLVTRSTVPVGTADRLRSLVLQEAPNRDVRVASNPEFLSEGNAVALTMTPDRVIIGSRDPAVIEMLSTLYRPFVSDDRPLIVMDEKSAEVTKYAANAFLALRISFMNELSVYCDAVGVDIEMVRYGISFDPRIGRRYLHAGLGFGGSCLPKDIRALAQSAREAGTPLLLVERTAQVNAEQLERFFQAIAARFGGTVRGRRFALWGLAFKPNTDDTREAPAYKLLDKLLEGGACVVVYDPAAVPVTQRRYGNRIEYAGDMYAALSGADALVIATEWEEFRNADLERVRNLLGQPIIFDGRNLWQPNNVHKNGLEYYSIGRGLILSTRAGMQMPSLS